MNKPIAEVFALLGTYEEMIAFLKSNLLLSPSELWDMFKYLPQDLTHEDNSGVKALTVAKAVVEHPNLAPEQILYFLTHSRPCLKSRALRHKNFPPNILDEEVKKAVFKNKVAVVNRWLSNPTVNKKWVREIIDRGLFNQECDWTMKFLCKNVETEEDFELLKNLNLTSSQQIVLLDNSKTPLEILEKLSKNYWHHLKFLKHPNINQELKVKAINYIQKHLPDLYHKLVYESKVYGQVA